MSWTIDLPDKARKEIQLLAVMGCGALLVFISFLVNTIAALDSPQPPGNSLFGVFFSGFSICFILLVGWNFFLLAVHVIKISGQNGVLTLYRAFAPSIRIVTSREWRVTESAIPVLGPPCYNRGTLFRYGSTLFYISDYMPHARGLTDALLSNDFSRMDR